jgi:hypothetical protein
MPPRGEPACVGPQFGSSITMPSRRPVEIPISVVRDWRGFGGCGVVEQAPLVTLSRLLLTCCGRWELPVCSAGRSPYTSRQ